ncbi:DJ-1/PfpI family protein [Massilia sp. H-1]|nr:DJ-1/PfpI family protein [Massilia sp. H-1]
MKTVAILLFDEVEVLDFAGPFEVFGVAGGADGLYRVITVAESAHPVLARNMLSVIPSYDFASMPHADILVVPGGYGTRRERLRPEMLAFIRDKAAAAELVLSVCSGALLLAKAGLLAGLHATTHRGALAELAIDEPYCVVLPNARVVDNGKVILSAGISMGIEASLHIVARQHGAAVADATAAYMEYDWNVRQVADHRLAV